MKQEAVELLRSLHLIRPVELALFAPSYLKNFVENRRFKRDHPSAVLPPPFLIYNTYGFVDYHAYWSGGKQAAEYLGEVIDKNFPRHRRIEILEWGSGPGRVISHLPRLLEGRDARISGSDYERSLVDWCKRGYPQIDFSQNDTAPPLRYQDGRFDLIYAVSIFTHLSEDLHYAWLAELKRVLNDDGLLIVSTHGDNSRSHLLAHERLKYDAGELVCRGKVKMGSRLYTAYQSPKFMREFLREFELVSHDDANNRFAGLQDVWVVRK